MKCKRFPSFEDAKNEWIQLEKSIQHYPFQTFWYNKLFAQKFCNPTKVHILGIYKDNTLIAIGAFEVIESRALLIGMKKVLGRQDITDYGDILYDQKSNEISKVWDTIQDYFRSIAITSLQLDYVREDSATFVVFQPTSKAKISKQNVSPFISLPSSWEEYLQKLDKKDRHELKRKMRRLEKETAFKLYPDEIMPKEFEEFIRLHKLSDPDKKKFMSKGMEEVFWNIITSEKTNWQAHICSLIINEKHAASVFMFVNNDHLLLYNSGLDPEFRYFSVGLLMHAFLIKRAIEEKKKIYDFLRGDERYKYDLGATDMPLHQICMPLS